MALNEARRPPPFWKKNLKVFQIIIVEFDNVSYFVVTEGIMFKMSDPNLYQPRLDQSIWGQFHQHFTFSFYAYRSQKCKKDSQLNQHFALSGSASVKAACKHVGEIDPCSLYKLSLVYSCLRLIF